MTIDLTTMRGTNLQRILQAIEQSKAAAVPAPQPAAPVNLNPATNWSYRPSNQYQKYSDTQAAMPSYGRNPLVPFRPQAQTANRPGASALLSAFAAKQAAPKDHGGPIRRAYAEGGNVNDIMQILSGLGLGRMPAMAGGGPVMGMGGGQQDNVMQDSPVGSFIIPADVVADLGDGNTDEGHRRLGSTWNRVHMASGGRVGYAGGGGIDILKILASLGLGGLGGGGIGALLAKGGSVGSVPVALSAGEHEVPPEIVSAIGGGSNKAGTDKLMKMIKRVRAHKATKRHPPKAKSPLSYMGKAS